MLIDVCHATAKPLVSASVIGMTGYAGAFCGGGPSYRAVFPEVSVDGGTCATVGVIGTAVAVLGGLQAHLALHLLPPRNSLRSSMRRRAAHASAH